MNEKIVDEYLDKKEQEAIEHGIYSLLASLGQDYTAGVNAVVPGDKGKELYKRNSKLHSRQYSNDDIDDGQISHEAPKFFVDSLITYPMATAIAAGVNAMNLADPRASAIYKLGGNAAMNVGLGSAKAKAAGRDYGWKDLGFDVIASLGADSAAALGTMPHLGKYMASSMAGKALAHGGAMAKAAAKDFEDNYLFDESSANNYDNLYALGRFRE